MKNVNNEFGYAQFLPTMAQKTALASALSQHDFPDTSAERAFVLDAFSSLRYEYELCAALGGDTGSKCPDGERWKSLKEDCAVSQALKEVYINFIEQNYIPSEFMLVVWSMVCDIQADHLIQDDQ